MHIGPHLFPEVFDVKYKRHLPDFTSYRWTIRTNVSFIISGLYGRSCRRLPLLPINPSSFPDVYLVFFSPYSRDTAEHSG